jgi:hypothetical protein
MKRKLLFGVAFLLVAWAATSCEKSCQTCKIVTRNISDGTEVSSDGGSQYCGADLVAFKATNPTITNNTLGTVTKVECN